MKKSDISTLEKKLNIILPQYYCEVILNYPYIEGSFADEFLLPNDKERLLELNEEEIIEKNNNPYIIGSDGGEEYYFIKTNSVKGQVFLYDLESSNISIKAENFQEYLKQINTTLKEIDEDEKAELERKKNKKWWEFWK